MSWDLRPKYKFDATEGQIPEGFASVYGQANSHANCVPASFTAALDFAGFGDIDPQLVTNQIYGPNFRGGFGDFTKMIAWIKAHISNAPIFSDGPFNFAQAEAAGQNGQLVIVAGWIIPSSVTFAAKSMSGGFSHASLLVAHRADDSFLIWNTWTGAIQVYSRTVLAASLYEMSIMSKPTFSLGSGSLGDDDMTPDEHQWSFTAADNSNKILALLNAVNVTTLGRMEGEIKAVQASLAALPSSGSGDGSAIAVLTAKVDALAGSVAAIRARVEKDLA